MNKLNLVPTRAKAIGLGLLASLATAAAHAQSAFVAYDSQTGAVSFTPANLVSPLITAVIAALTAGVAIFVIMVGSRWVKKLIKGSK